MNKTLQENAFNDFDNPQIIWELFGELLDFYADQEFCAKQVAYETNTDVKQINRILHRLIRHKAVICTGTDHWNVKTYRISEEFIP